MLKEKRNFTEEHRRKLSLNNPKSQKIVCKLVTGEEIPFGSIRECERTFGISRQTILNWIDRGISKKGSLTFESIEVVH